jgi:hypothetical protein
MRILMSLSKSNNHPRQIEVGDANPGTELIAPSESIKLLCKYMSFALWELGGVF